MVLNKLDIYRVRNIKHISFSPVTGINFFYGLNGCGKSALLEAIFILGRAKSFRAKSIQKVIQLGADDIIVSGTSVGDNKIPSQLGIKLSKKQVEIRINSETNVPRSELAYTLPIQLIHPKSYELMDGGSRLRREFIDWGVFTLYDDFLSSWRKFNKSLKHRNAVLKLKQQNQLQVWNQEFVQYGTIVHDFRCRYMALLQPVFFEVVKQFLPFTELQFKILPGWDIEIDLLLLLDESLEKDLHYGYTHHGPHRGDFSLTINGRQAKDFVSRGQMKLIILALKIAQVKLLTDQRQINSCILIDDITAELDIENRTRLLTFLSTLKTQIFITATQETEFGDISTLADYKMFHVEHGEITPS